MTIDLDLPQQLANKIFEPDLRRLDKQQLHIIAENGRLNPASVDGFLHMGKFYTDHKTTARKNLKRGELHHNLVPQMHAHLVDEKQVLRDHTLVRQGLAMLLLSCRNWQDVRDALPNGLAELLPNTQNLARTRPEGWCLGTPRAMKQYEQIKPLIDSYLVSRLLF